MSKVTKCNTDTIPHAAPVITAVHWKSGQKQWNRESPEAEDGLMTNHHPHQAEKKKKRRVLKHYQLLETVKKTTEQKGNIPKNREAASMYKVSGTQNISRLLIHRDCFWSRDIRLWHIQITATFLAYDV